MTTSGENWRLIMKTVPLYAEQKDKPLDEEAEDYGLI